MSKKEKKSSPALKDVDSGWARVALFATFVCFLIQTGSMLSKGVYMPTYLDHFGQGRSNTFWIGSVYLAFYHFGSILSSFAVARFGARLVVMAGGLLLALAYAILSIVESINTIIVIYGILGGIGGIFVISGCIAILPLYFKKNLFIASGIMFGGGGVGVMSVGGLTEFLIDHFDWRGALLIQSGVCLQACVCASLMFDTGLTPIAFGTLKRHTNRRASTKEEQVEYTEAKHKLLDSPQIDEINGNEMHIGLKHSSVLDFVIKDESIRYIDDTDDCRFIKDQDEMQTSIDQLKEKGANSQIELSEKLLDVGKKPSQQLDQQIVASPINGHSKPIHVLNYRHRLRAMLIGNRFWIITFATQFASMAGFTAILFFKDMLRHANLGSRLMVVFMGSGGVFGRVSAGFIARHVNRFLYFAFIMFVLCCDLLLLLVADARWTVLGIGFLVTTCQGTGTVLHTLMALDVYGRSGMHLAWTWSMALAGIGVLAAGPIGGLVADITDSYTGTICLLASWALVASMLGLTLFFLQRHPPSAETFSKEND